MIKREIGGRRPRAAVEGGGLWDPADPCCSPPKATVRVGGEKLLQVRLSCPLGQPKLWCAARVS